MKGGIDSLSQPCAVSRMSTRQMGLLHDAEISTSLHCLTFRALWFECLFFLFLEGVFLALMDGRETRGELGQRVYRVGARRAVYD